VLHALVFVALVRLGSVATVEPVGCSVAARFEEISRTRVPLRAILLNHPVRLDTPAVDPAVVAHNVLSGQGPHGRLDVVPLTVRDHGQHILQESGTADRLAVLRGERQMNGLTA
jgi:hypothetical protein